MTYQPIHFDGEHVRLEAATIQPFIESLGIGASPSALISARRRIQRVSPVIRDEALPLWQSPHVQVLGQRKRTCVFVDRLRGSRHTEIIDHLKGLMASPQLAGRCRLALDARRASAVY